MSPSNEESCLSDDERRVIKLCRQKTAKLSLDDARILVRLWLRGAEFQDALKGNPELRSSILKRQTTTESVVTWTEDGPSSQLTARPSLPLRWQTRPPAAPEHASELAPAAVCSLIKAAKVGDAAAYIALQALAHDLRAAGRPLSRSLAKFAVQPKRRSGKRGPDPTSRHMLGVVIFGLLQKLKKHGVNPTRGPAHEKWECGASIIADESRVHGAHLTEGAVVEVWKDGIAAISKIK